MLIDQQLILHEQPHLSSAVIHAFVAWGHRWWRAVRPVGSGGRLRSLNHADPPGCGTGVLSTSGVSFGQVTQPLCLSLLFVC